MKKIVLAMAAMLSVAACAPSDGPSASNVLNGARRANVPVLPLSDTVVQSLGRPQSSGSMAQLGNAPYQSGIIKPGDTVSVTLFDTGEAALFDVAQSGSLPLGDYVVSPSGTVDLPFAGALDISGQSTADAQGVVTRKLQENAVNPSASVIITRKDTDTFSVQGDVPNAGAFQLTAAGEKVLEAIALAGGASTEPADTMVTLLRGSRRASQPLDRIIADSGSNIFLQPGDTLIVGGGDAEFVAEGALAASGSFSFIEGSLPLSKAIAKAGGLQSSRANPRSVFLMRRMPANESFILQASNGEQRVVTGDVIFRANYKDPNTILRAGNFQMRDGDVIYVGDAPLAAFSKYFQIFNTPPEGTVALNN